MSTKNKIMQLMKEGFKLTTLKKLDEKQINVLHKKIVSEGVLDDSKIAVQNTAMAKQNLEDMSELMEDGELNEWGSSDQNIMNNSIHRDLGEPEEMPSPFSRELESAAEDAVDFYWDDWEEYETDRDGLIDDAKRRYLRSYFPEQFNALVRMFEPIKEVDPYDVDIDLDGELGEDTELDNSIVQPKKYDPDAGNTVTNNNGPTDNMDADDGMGIFEGKKKPVKMKTPITTLGMFEGELEEKSVSQQQQKIMGLALSVKRGDTPRSEVSKDVLDMVDGMTEKELEDFASTKHKGLPNKVETNEGTKCWKGYEKKGMKTMFGKRVPNCVKKESTEDKVRQIEESIVSLIKNYKKPTMSKKDFVKYIRE